MLCVYYKEGNVDSNFSSIISGTEPVALSHLDVYTDDAARFATTKAQLLVRCSENIVHSTCDSIHLRIER